MAGLLTKTLNNTKMTNVVWDSQMKTLKDLKENLYKYEVKLCLNSILNYLPPYQACWRSVGQITKNRFSLITVKNDKSVIEMWFPFPKSYEMSLTQLEDGLHQLEISRDQGEGKYFHVLVFELRKLNDDGCE